jgi:hypothetical protein
MQYLKKISLLIVFMLSFYILDAQVSLGGEPMSLKSSNLVQVVPLVEMPAIDLAQLDLEDQVNDKFDGLYRFAQPFPVKLNAVSEGVWENLPDGGRLWRLNISCPGALNMNLIFGDLYLPKGSKMFIYNEDKSQVLGAFSSHNNKESRSLATALIYGDFLTVEYYEPTKSLGLGTLEISQVAHGYRGLNDDPNKIDESGACQVNVNCSPEGDGIWQDIKKGVARIIINGSGLCTGSLVSNTGGDCTPYFLTADHCIDGTYDAIDSPNANIVFFWNYEREGCANTGAAPLNQTSSGATVVANAGSSDFALLRIEGTNPADVYDVYFNGWDRSGDTGTGGKGIHHPAGDIKKIATHSVSPTSNGNYWRLFWDATLNGYSVTEGGSSGSPLFRANGRVVGQLLGGSALNCSDPANDVGVYGKISVSWTNGNNADSRRRLDAWLDPSNTGLTVFDGAYDPCAIPEISFLTGASTTNEEAATTEDACNDYQDHLISIFIRTAPSVVADVSIVDLGTGTATAGEDYDVLTTGSLSLSSGTLSQDFMVRVYDDAKIESDETIVLGYVLNANGGDALADGVNQTHTVTIADMDLNPLPTSNPIFIDFGFETGIGTFTSTSSGADQFVQGNAAALASVYWSVTGNGTNFAFVSDDSCNCDLSDVKLITPAMDFSALINATLTFDHAFSDISTESASILVSIDGGTTWSGPVYSITNTSIDNGGGVYTTPWQTGTMVDLSAYSGESNVKIAFQYNDGGIWLYGMAIDNVQITGNAPLEVQADVVSTEENLGPNETVHFYEPATGNIMCTIENTSSHDYGCTTVQVDRAGTSFQDIGGNNRIFDKNYLITPTIENPTGTYNLTLYYTAAERDGFINDNDLAYQATDLLLFKAEANLSTANAVTLIALNEISFGQDYGYTASINTGFSGFAPGAGNGVLPTSFVKLNARVRLQGALIGSTDGMMRDELRAQELLPATDPYAGIAAFTHVGGGGTETVTDPTTVFADHGGNSIVDWVFVELRSSLDSTQVVETRAGLLQKDGDIVDIDGLSSLCFNQSVPGNYYVAVRHRNHIGTMVASAVALTGTGTIVDFTNTATDLWNSQANYDGIEQVIIGGQYALWAGNTDSDGQIIFAGQFNDNDPTFDLVNTAASNFFGSQTFILPGYFAMDVNLDGRVVFAGQDNEVDLVFNNVDMFPLNSFGSDTFIVFEQLPR